MLFTAEKGANRLPLSVSTIEYDKNQPRKVFDLNGCEMNENQVKGVVIVKQGKKTYQCAYWAVQAET